MHRRIASWVGTGAIALAFACVASPARAVSTPTSVTLAWTAPGDDSLTGTAALYDVRYSTSPIDAGNFTSAVPATGVPAPSPSGTTETMLVSGLTPSTAYWFAIRTRDESGNWSGISNIVAWVTPTDADSVRPAPLAVTLAGSTASSVSLQWTASGDDSLTGNADRYDVRWSTSAITAANFFGATHVTSGVPAPSAPGSVQGCTVTGLDRSVNLWFAVRVADEVNNWSGISNVIAVPLLLDAAPPATPTGLSAAHEASTVHLHWNANAEADLAGYHVYRSSTEGGPYVRLDGTLLADADFVDPSPPDSAAAWYAVSAEDVHQNESARTSAVRVWLQGDGIPSLALQAAYPNPSTGGTVVSIPVAVPPGNAIDGRLDIVNAAGERVRSLTLRGLAPGTTVVTWDGRNESGRPIAPGVYRALLYAGSNVQVVRLVRTP